MASLGDKSVKERRYPTMSPRHHRSLERVVESFDQLVDAVSVWLLFTAQSSDQLVLARATISDMLRLKRTLQKEMKLKSGNGERLWQVVHTVITVVVNHALNWLSKPSHYLRRREHIVCSRLFVRR